MSSNHTPAKADATDAGPAFTWDGPVPADVAADIGGIDALVPSPSAGTADAGDEGRGR